MKKYILILLTIFTINTAQQGVFANNFILNPDLTINDKREIKSILNKHSKSLAKHNIEGIRPFYDKEYISADGFDLKDTESMLKKTFDTYENIDCKTKINDISVFNDWAIAQLSDYTMAKIYPEKKKRSKKLGILEGRSSYVVYLKKEKDGWKIVYDDILMEETTLKYGIANQVKIDLIVPAFIKKGQEYDIKLKMDKPQDIVALASLSREEIVYPPVGEYKEKFRKLPEDGTLERLVKANKNNLDEYAAASIGFTRVSVNEDETRARIEVLGMAYIMKRINMKEDKILPKTKEEKQKELM